VFKARQGVDEMVDAVDGQLERIESLVASADDGSG
jgi:hypothetical protein